MTSSASDVDVEEEEEEYRFAKPIDESVCPVCGGSTYSGDTIGCESCPGWFHFGCVGVRKGDPEVEDPDFPYDCPRCRRIKVRGTPGRGRGRGKRSTPPRGNPHVDQLQHQDASPKKKKRGRPRKNGSGASSVRRESSSSASSPVKKKRGRPAKAAADAPSALPKSPPIKLKINFGRGGSVVASSSSPSTSRRKSSSETYTHAAAVDSSDEEERWLDAVDKGEDVSAVVDPELRSIKNPKLMTARQRAMAERAAAAEEDLPAPTLEEEGHLALDYYGGKKKASQAEDEDEEDAEEKRRLKEIKVQKRKEAEQEKKEAAKKETMDKLLKKKEAKVDKKASAAAAAMSSREEMRERVPMITYKQAVDQTWYALPEGHEYALSPKKVPPPAEKRLCGREGCAKPRSYTCSKTGIPLCSLECYKKNTQEQEQVSIEQVSRSCDSCVL